MMKKVIAKIGRRASLHTGSVRHFSSSESGPGSLAELPGPTSLSIVKEDDGFFLLRMDELGSCISDTWHFSLEDAKRQAAFEFAIDDSDWEEGE